MIKTAINSIGDDSNVEYYKYDISLTCKDKNDFKYFEVEWRAEEQRKRMSGEVA